MRRGVRQYILKGLMQNADHTKLTSSKVLYTVPSPHIRSPLSQLMFPLSHESVVDPETELRAPCAHA